MQVDVCLAYPDRRSRSVSRHPLLAQRWSTRLLARRLETLQQPRLSLSARQLVVWAGSDVRSGVRGVVLEGAWGTYVRACDMVRGSGRPGLRHAWRSTRNGCSRSKRHLAALVSRRWTIARLAPGSRSP